MSFASWVRNDWSKFKIGYIFNLHISLSTYDFSTLYTTLPHNLIKDKLIDLIERTFQREDSPYLACSDRNAFLLQKNLKNIMHGRVKMYVMR